MNRIELLNALEIVRPGLSNKEIMEQSTSFAFIDGQVVTFNDEISIRHPVKGLTINGAVPATALYQLLRKVNKDEIEITEESNQILISAGRSKAGLAMEAKISLPIEETIQPGKFHALPEDFISAVQFALPCCDGNSKGSKPMLSCVHVNDSGFVEGSNGNRIAHYKLKGKMPVKTFLVPATSMRALLRLPITKIAEGKGFIHFKTDEGTMMSCRLFEDDFPDTSPFLTIKNAQKLTLPKSIIDIMDRAGALSGVCASDLNIKLSLNKNRVKVTNKSDFGWFEEESNAQYTGEPMTLIVTPYNMKVALEETKDCEYNENIMRFKTDNWTYVVTLSVEPEEKKKK